MTIALAIIGQQCLVMGADTQETWGSQKYRQGKIMSAWRGAPNPPGAICVSGAGSGPHIDTAAEQIVNHFQSFLGTMDEFESWLRNFVYLFYRKHVMPFIGKTHEVPDFQLIIGARHAQTFRLWTTYGTVITNKNPYAVAGISAGSSSALIGQLYQDLPSLNVSALLAAYVVRQSKLSSDGVGFETEIRFIYKDGTGIVPPENIRAWEAVFEKYEYLQREVFGHISGFVPLTIRLPGTVVVKPRQFRDVLRDLNKMRKELQKLPVIKGLDDPATRLISKTSELEQ